ncbi:MAG: phosphoribosylaminoimidazolecarboxamide formyltransferase, partial [Clostridiales bacterium]
MRELTLKYGCNPHQQPARIFMEQGELPITVLNGKPGYINFLDAFNSWQLVQELKTSLELPAAASFKHVSPAGAAIAQPLSETLQRMYFIDAETELSPLATAYIRARGADRMSSFGDWIALSDVCDVPTAAIIAHEVSDGVIAPGYEPEALAILKTKRKGNYNIVQMDENYQPPSMETKQVYGISFEQQRNHLLIDRYLLKNIVSNTRYLPDTASRDLLIALITLKYTQSNSVCYAKDGQTIGVGAGQQSRIHCTRLAGDKADLWHLRQHPAVLELPFRQDLTRPERDNALDVYLSVSPEDVLGINVWSRFFDERPKALLDSEKQVYLRGFHDVALGSD